MNLCMGSLLWLKCHLHNKTPPCFLCWFSNNTVSYTVGISPTACTKSAIFRRFLTPLQKLDIIRIILRNSRFVKFFFMFFMFLLQKSYPQLIPNLWISWGLLCIACGYLWKRQRIQKISKKHLTYRCFILIIRSDVFKFD